ncbi:Cupin domain protein [Roseivivax sp. THAF40]|uniref:cupin domain-containing protein n=1 Tax=unclassified Roseivivax TaxID=2639302 RepID=UPI001267E079|nr:MULTISPECIES: cupin domain-containing protein [unclassified Roseivivax]QFS83353.1 Cupin domain protein [Roseivivax sp. THAF197b]QFT47097.1 Cupin domain protein [Roseivivax sp. THAF40]
MHNGAGVTSSNEGLDGIAWNVVGHIYRPKLVSADAFVWHAEIPAETFVPPHVHPHQDEWIYVLSGALEVDFGFEAGNVQPHRAGAGDMVRMPKGVLHAVFNRSGADATCLFGVSPTRKLFDLFGALDGVTEPAELMRLSALHEVDFLPPPDAEA